ncbi:MAG: PIG-L family deacetylase, partial [Verrucomicrobiota bacterium]
EVMDKKLDGLAGMISQFAEGGANGYKGLMPDDPAGREKRLETVRNNFRNRNESLANKFRSKLEEWYGKDRAAGIKYAEAFEICEYGRRPGKEELAKLFPFFAKD